MGNALGTGTLNPCISYFDGNYSRYGELLAHAHNLKVAVYTLSAVLAVIVFGILSVAAKVGYARYKRYKFFKRPIEMKDF